MNAEIGPMNAGIGIANSASRALSLDGEVLSAPSWGSDDAETRRPGDGGGFDCLVSRYMVMSRAAAVVSKR